MKWANFLHFYQPAGQQKDILEAIITQSYRPILEVLKKNKRVRLTLNLNGALLELFDEHGHHSLIDLLRELGNSGRVEFTSSSKYHAFLPLINENEVVRQISTNNETNKFFLGSAYVPKGFFPPEMAYKEELVHIAEEFGFQWMVLDEIALDGLPGHVDYTKIYRVKKSNLLVFFRERRLSNLIMSAVVRSKETLKEAMAEDMKSGRYVLTAMDAETFGHHRPGLEKMLLDIFMAPEFNFVQISDITKFYSAQKEIRPIPSTWASSREDIQRGIQFLSWKDPENIIHTFQWKFLELTMDEFYKVDNSSSIYPVLRNKMDKALASDHFWWASAKPWWSVEMIEVGAWNLLEVIRSLPHVSEKILHKASGLYEKIISTALRWQRTGKIRDMAYEQKSILRIPFKDRTLGRGGSEKGVYEAFMNMMKGLEKNASKMGEYEKAILWRDAQYKLANQLDIYDTINAIDLLRVEIPHKEVEATIEKYKSRYREIRGGQPEQRGS